MRNVRLSHGDHRELLPASLCASDTCLPVVPSYMEFSAYPEQVKQLNVVAASFEGKPGVRPRGAGGADEV